jgi:toxin ParE1/3/4
VKLSVSPEAECDLDEIEAYIGADNPVAAVNFVKQLTDAFAQLTANPRIGRKRDYLRTGLRSITKGDYMILYWQKNDAIEIVRVLHSARDIEALFLSLK